LSFGTGVELIPRMRMVSESLLLVASDDQCAISFHGAVCDFKRRLIEATLLRAHGNRTHAAQALGLQRTYLLRLIRELGVAAPPPPPRRGARM
jgi:DNA-binding NtrC family response regulator